MSVLHLGLPAWSLAFSVSPLQLLGHWCCSWTRENFRLFWTLRFASTLQRLGLLEVPCSYVCELWKRQAGYSGINKNNGQVSQHLQHQSGLIRYCRNRDQALGWTRPGFSLIKVQLSTKFRPGTEQDSLCWGFASVISFWLCQILWLCVRHLWSCRSAGWDGSLSHKPSGTFPVIVLVGRQRQAQQIFRVCGLVP